MEKALSTPRASTREREDHRLPQEDVLKKARIASIILLFLQIRGFVRFLVGYLSWYYRVTCVEVIYTNGT